MAKEFKEVIRPYVIPVPIKGIYGLKKKNKKRARAYKNPQRTPCVLP